METPKTIVNDSPFGRVTNVDPIPDEIVRQAYAEPDDEEERASIRKMIASQSQT